MDLNIFVHHKPIVKFSLLDHIVHRVFGVLYITRNCSLFLSYFNLDLFNLLSSPLFCRRVDSCTYIHILSLKLFHCIYFRLHESRGGVMVHFCWHFELLKCKPHFRCLNRHECLLSSHYVCFICFHVTSSESILSHFHKSIFFTLELYKHVFVDTAS